MNKIERNFINFIISISSGILASVIANLIIVDSIKGSIIIGVISSTLIFAFLALIVFDTTASDSGNQPDEPDEIAGSPYIVGPPIKEPAYFVGRQDEVRRFFDTLNGPQPQPLQVLGIRRAGKTSFLRYVSHPDVVAKKVRDADNTLVIYIDLQTGVSTVPDFYMALAKGINRCLPNRSLVISESLPNIEAFVRLLDSPKLSNYRFIFLLDEFERLWKDARPEEAPFDSDFFIELRSLVNTYLGRLVWVTSSYINLYRLSKELGENEKTSPFFNIFDPYPIVLGKLTSNEANELIGQGNIKENAFSSIKQLAGQLPFFLQVASKAWFNAKYKNENNFSEIEAEVKQEFGSAMRSHFDWYWRHFEKHERELLKVIALEVPNGVRFYQQKHGNAVLNDLVRYGLITQEKQNYHIASEVFAEWIRRAQLRVPDQR